MLLLIKDPIRYSHRERISIFSDASLCLSLSLASYAELMSMFLVPLLRILTEILNNADAGPLLTTVPSV